MPTIVTFPLRIYPAIVSTPSGQYRGVRLDIERHPTNPSLVVGRIYGREGDGLVFMGRIVGAYVGSKFRGEIRGTETWYWNKGGGCGTCGGAKWLRMDVPTDEWVPEQPDAVTV